MNLNDLGDVSYMVKVTAYDTICYFGPFLTQHDARKWFTRGGWTGDHDTVQDWEIISLYFPK